MSYQVNFLDNRAISAETINQISEELGGSATNFTDGTVYGVDSLNDISSSLIGKGVSRGCSLSFTENKVTISAGVLFMGSGKRVSIDEEGITLSCEPGMSGFICFCEDINSGFVAPAFVSDEPVGENDVVLGELTEGGDLLECSYKAVMKNPYLGLHFSETFTVTIPLTGEEEESLVAEFVPEDTGHRFVMIKAYPKESESRTNSFSGCVDLLTGQSFGIASTASSKVDEYERGTVSQNSADYTVISGLCEASVYNKHCFVHLRVEYGDDKVLRLYEKCVQTIVGGAERLPTKQTLVLTLC